MLPPAPSILTAQSSATVSAETSRATSRSVEVRLKRIKLGLNSRSSSIEAAEDSGDPDWDETEDVREVEQDDDPEYDPESGRDKGKKPIVNV